MAILKCKSCGGDLNIADNAGVYECEYCGLRQTVAKTQEEGLQGLYNRANMLRIKGEFDKAESLYEKILQNDSQQAEAYWGLILCKYGIEYVEDPKTFKRIPTCHRTSFDSVIADEDYKAAVKYADGQQKAVYEAEAKEIDRLQKEILALSKNEAPYDVFICYKETDEQGKRTQDSVIANDIYYQLTQEGFKVFYAAITLEDKLGAAYEPCIFAALNSAKVMLVVGTKAEYFNAVWVKNEWGRFLKMMKKDRSKTLIPCYRDMDAYDLPEEFAHLQAQDMSKIGFINDVVRGIKKLIVTETAPVAVAPVAPVGGGNANALLSRGYLMLEDGEWQKADDFFEQVLNQDAQCAEAYLGKLMVELKVRHRERLNQVKDAFDGNNHYKKAVRFGSEALKAELQGYVDAIVNRNLEEAYVNAVKEMKSAKDDNQYQNAAYQFREIGDYKDAAMLAEECMAKAEAYFKETTYQQCISRMNNRSVTSVSKAIEGFERILDYKDAAAKLEECQALLQQLKEQKAAEERVVAERRTAEDRASAAKWAEKQRAAAEKSAEEAQTAKMKKKRKTKRFFIGFAVTILAVLVGFLFVYPYIAFTQGNYRVYIDMYQVEEYSVPRGVEEIKEEAFYCCTSLESVTIPQGVTSIGRSAFNTCRALTEVSIPDSVVVIDESAFSTCVSLAEITIPDSVRIIGDHAFAWCFDLTEVTIPEGVTILDEGAFFSCESLNEVTIPSSVTEIGDYAFDGVHLETIYYGGTMEQWQDLYNPEAFSPVYRVENEQLYFPVVCSDGTIECDVNL